MKEDYKITKREESPYLNLPIVCGVFDEKIVCNCGVPTTDIPRLGGRAVAIIRGEEWHAENCSRVLGSINEEKTI